MRRQLSVVAAVAIAAATVSLPMTVADAAPTHPATAVQAAATTVPQWYLALGDSLAAGYQPGKGDNPTGGYVGGALQMLKLQNPNITATNLGCSGEDTKTFTNGTKCDGGDPAKSQLTRAVTFLKAHAKTKGVVTFDLGANDIDGCVAGGAIDMKCLQSGLGDVAKNLPTILQKLHAAAPNAKIVVLNYYNPFLAVYLTGTQGQQTAKQSELLATLFNGSIASAAATINAPVADIAKAFLSNADTPMVSTSFGKLPTNVARICTWTWMCTKQNIHPTDAGYTLMWWTLAPYLKS
ncbi:SGNH/GDSL hydrolase family protein [Flexivirga alba]|uniref:SGNH/GDSL hydrolase family protein n=1 Tax=Flexivirga alba TaxID=702742 RepID=A0ABW2AGI1_9MICO